MRFGTAQHRSANLKMKCLKIVSLLMLLWVVVLVALPTHGQSDAPSSTIAPTVDPNRASSEFNHHIAGYGLIALGLIVIAGLVFSKVRWLRVLWPLLFVAIGVYL